METIFARVEERGDLFARVTGPGQNLGEALDRLGLDVPRDDVSGGRVRRAITPSGP